MKREKEILRETDEIVSSVSNSPLSGRDSVTTMRRNGFGIKTEFRTIRNGGPKKPHLAPAS